MFSKKCFGSRFLLFLVFSRVVINLIIFLRYFRWQKWWRSHCLPLRNACIQPWLAVRHPLMWFYLRSHQIYGKCPVALEDVILMEAESLVDLNGDQEVLNCGRLLQNRIPASPPSSLGMTQVGCWWSCERFTEQNRADGHNGLLESGQTFQSMEEVGWRSCRPSIALGCCRHCGISGSGLHCSHTNTRSSAGVSSDLNLDDRIQTCSGNCPEWPFPAVFCFSSY